MKIAIVGAGIVGVTTAWELACDGHEVTVFERRGAAAEESSFATAGLVSPGTAAPWGGPGLRATVLRALLSSKGRIDGRWPLALRELRWLGQWRKASRLETYVANRTRMQRLAAYSQTRLREIRETRELDYERGDGCLVLLRSKRDRKAAEIGLDVLRATGTLFREIDADEARSVETALSTDTSLFGAIHLPDDEVANCRQFALLLRREAEALGARFYFGCDIAPLSRAEPRALSLAGGSESHPFDAVVVCTGAASAPLVRPLGLRLPMASVHGYAISANVREPLNAPRSAVVDARHQVDIARLGMRVRVSGGAEIGGSPAVLNPAALQTLYKVLHSWFPGAATLQAGVQQWKGARPMLPDGPPVIGASGIPGVWLNLGHGDHGWAMACGSARAVADLIGHREPGVDLEGLGIERLL